MSIEKVFQGLLISVFICGLTTNSTAQTLHESAWFRLFVRKNINPRWQWQAEVDERRRFFPGQQLQFITHQRLQWQLNRQTHIAFGPTWSNVMGRNELRMSAEVQWSHPTKGKWGFSHRFRTDQRYFLNPDQYRWRLRYRFQTEYKIHPDWRLRFADEFMWQQSDWDQNRIYLATVYERSKHWQFELGYMLMLQNRLNKPDDLTNLLRLTFYLPF